MMCEILSRPSSLPSSLVQLFSSLIVQNHSAIQYYQINLEPFRALEVLQEGGPLRFRFLQKSLCLFVSLKNLFKQCKVGIAKILSARSKVTFPHFIKGLLVYFLYPANGHKLWLLAKNENASNIKRLFPEFSGDGGVERSNLLGLRGFHSNRTSLWSGHLLPMQGFFQVTFVFRSGSYWLQHILI